MNENNTVDEFFKDLPSDDKKDADIFSETKPTEQVETKKEEEAEETDSDSRKNRRHRRLEEQLQRERESNIALNERLKVLSETERFAKDVEIDPRIAKMFDSTDVGKENALRLADVLSDMTSKAKEEALREIESEKQKTAQEQREYESLIDSELESLEDAHNVDLTSNSPQARKTRREFLEMVQSLSPKDDDGTITGYADFGSAFEIYQKTKQDTKVTNPRQREIASKSMQRSSSQTDTERQVTPGFNGWRKDFGLE